MHRLGIHDTVPLGKAIRRTDEGLVPTQALIEDSGEHYSTEQLQQALASEELQQQLVELLEQ